MIMSHISHFNSMNAKLPERSPFNRNKKKTCFQMLKIYRNCIALATCSQLLLSLLLNFLVQNAENKRTASFAVGSTGRRCRSIMFSNQQHYCP